MLKVMIVLLAITALGITTACGVIDALKAIGEEFRDDDGDGWYTNAHNRATTLSLVSATFSAPGLYRVLIDDVRFPLTASLDGTLFVDSFDKTLTLNIPVAKRVTGTAHEKTRGGVAYHSSVRVRWVPLIGPGVPVGLEGSVDYTSNGGETPTLQFTTTSFGIGTTVTLRFSSTTTFFSDPNPMDANGDSDGDGITEQEETILSNSFNGLGDPRPGGIDVVLIVGHTTASMRITQETREALKTQFFRNRINLHIDDGTLNGRPGSGGLMTRAATGALTLGEVATIRAQTIPLSRRRFAYLAVLAEDFTMPGLRFSFGGGNSIPGNQLGMIGAYVSLFPDIFSYQSGVLMHELGHLLGLCHPTDVATCAPLPPSEQDPGGTVMGSPVENAPTDPAIVINAMRRPLDYSPTQWIRLRIGAGLAP